MDLDTEGAVWKYVHWDLEVCFSGVHSNTEALGNAMATWLCREYIARHSLGIWVLVQCLGL